MNKSGILCALLCAGVTHVGLAQTPSPECVSAAVQTRLTNGESPISIYNDCDSDASVLYGMEYLGGYIAYLNTNPGTNYGTGFVADLQDYSQEAIWLNYGSGYQSAGALQTGIGAGRANTALIVSKLGAPNPGADIPIYSYAAWISTLTRNGYNDWVLPSQDEMVQVVSNVIKPMGNCNVDGYWTSSEAIGNYRAAISVTCVPSSSPRMKNNGFGVRMIRYFGATSEMQTSQTPAFASLTLNGSLALAPGQQVVRLGFCIGGTAYPTTDAMRQASFTSPASFSMLIPYDEQLQGMGAYARACAIISENGNQQSVYGNQLSITYPQVVNTLAASSIGAFTANLGGQIVADTSGKRLGVGITIYQISGSTSTLAGAIGLRLNGTTAQGQFAAGLQPNSNYTYKATAYVYTADGSAITASYVGPEVAFQTGSPQTITVPTGLVDMRFTESEMAQVDYPANTKSVCSEVINRQTVCLGLQTNNARYLFLTPVDNSFETIVVKYVYVPNSNGRLVLSRTAAQTWSFWGIRYANGMTLDTTSQIITLTGEGSSPTNSTIKIPFSSIFTN
jgi:hypothetical protein